MGNICQCTLGKSNTAASSCPDLMQIAARIIIVPKYLSYGTVNKFANEAAVTKAALQARFDAADIDDRFFPLSQFKNVEEVKGESVYEEFTDKSKIKIEEGKRNFVGYIINQGSKYLGKIKTWGCQEWGVYIFDKNGNFIYITDEATKTEVRPIMVDANSLEAILMKATDTTSEKIKVGFDFLLTQKDELLRYIPAEDLDFDGLDDADVYALYDCSGVASAISTTGFTMTIQTDYGTKVKNLLITDFSIYNVTDSASVTALTMTESADGVYVFTYAAQTPADVLRLTPSKAKYDFADVVSVVITTP